MQRGGRLIGSVAVLAVAACTSQPQLQIRPAGNSAAMTAKPVPIRIAEARAQFALGNVALALETFRKAAREDPASTDALSGIAACYDRMARFDLSRRYYEMALAVAPGDTQLLGALAGSLEQQGARDEAASVRQEIALRLAAASIAQAPEPVAPPPQTAEVAPVAIAASVPEAAVVAEPLETTVEVAPVTAPALEVRMQAVEQAVPPSPAPSALPEAPAAVAELHLQPIPEPEVGTSVTVTLPPPRSAAPAMAETIETKTPAPTPEPEPLPTRTAEALPPEPTGPHLERLSMGVVALVTGDRPRWRAQTVARSEESTTVRFVPLREASASTSKVRLLNAARVPKLAARTRLWLTDRGWSPMPIGDAPAARSRSLIVYPASQRAVAQNLANQFGFAMEERADAKFVTMLLGRDAARIEELQPKTA